MGGFSSPLDIVLGLVPVPPLFWDWFLFILWTLFYDWFLFFLWTLFWDWFLTAEDCWRTWCLSGLNVLNMINISSSEIQNRPNVLGVRVLGSQGL